MRLERFVPHMASQRSILLSVTLRSVFRNRNACIKLETESKLQSHRPALLLSDKIDKLSIRQVLTGKAATTSISVPHLGLWAKSIAWLTPLYFFRGFETLQGLN